MKVIVFALCYNQAEILPFWLRHYAAFADELAVWDDHSTDGSRELLQANPKVVLRDWPYQSGIEEDLFLQFAYEWYPRAHPAYQWAIWVDTDEFIYHPDILGVLAEADRRNIEVIKPYGYNMMHEGLPKDDGHQIWELARKGVHAPLYSKPVIFKPNCTVRWTRGKHELENCKPRLWLDSNVKLLHYRYLGYEYTKRVNAKNLARCGLYTNDKSAAWSCVEGYRGEGSAEWAKYAMRLAAEVIEKPCHEDACETVPSVAKVQT